MQRNFQAYDVQKQMEVNISDARIYEFTYNKRKEGSGT